jgi:ribonuclease HI
MEEVDLDAAAPWTETTTITKISEAPKDEAAKFHNIAVEGLKESKKALLCYSDGSMREGNVGAGAVVYAMNGEVIEKAIPMGREAEVYDAELEGMRVAARMAVRECNRTPNEIESVHIYLDNQSAIMRSSHLRTGPGQAAAIAVNESARKLQRKGIKLHVEWVPGHEGVAGNEASDKVAGEATDLPHIFGTTTLSYIGRATKERKVKHWKTRWEAQKRSRNFTGSFRHLPDALLLNNNRRLVSTMSQLRTGHGYFNSYLGRPGNNNGLGLTPACKCGATRQTPEHLLVYCPKLNKDREVLRKECEEEAKQPTPLRFRNLLYDPSLMLPVAGYIKSTKMATRGWSLDPPEQEDEDEMEAEEDDEGLEEWEREEGRE